MKMTFIETTVFTETITGLLTDVDYRELQEHLLMSPTAGPVITGTAGCRKLRWKVSGRKGGKSGGMRAIYYHRMAQDKLFAKLMKSAEQAVEIARGQREPSRVFEVEAQVVKAIREQTGLSQVKFASLIHIPVSTLRNWEQGRRHPEGPAAALLTAIRNDPQRVVAALNA